MRKSLTIIILSIISLIGNTTYAWNYPDYTQEMLPSSEGLGTQDAPYVLKTAQDLANLSCLVNNGVTFKNCYFILANDIDLNPGFEFTVDGEIIGEGTPQTWTPIGYKKQFSGNLDGQGHTIKGLYQNQFYERPGAYSSIDWMAGLFGYMELADISNLTITNSLIKITSDSNTSSSLYAGMFSSYCGGVNFTNCHNEGSIYLNINQDYNTGTVGALSGEMPGFVNINRLGSIMSCSNSGNISFTKGHNIGGLIGYFWGEEISDCQNTGDIAGGYMVGGIAGRIEESHQLINLTNYGTIRGRCAGGIADDANNYYNDLENCFNHGDIFAESGFSGGLFGEYLGKNAKNCGNTGNVTNGSGLIDYCYLKEISDCYNTGRVEGSAGLIGGNMYVERVINCYNTGDVYGRASGLIAGLIGNFSYSDNPSVVESCYNTGNLYGGSQMSGIAGSDGYQQITFNNCYNWGDLMPNEIVDIYYRTQSGGICGYHKDFNGIQINNCYSIGKVGLNINAGPILFDLTRGEVVNSYYLNTCVDGDLEVPEEGGIAMNSEEFSKGYVCVLLNADQEPQLWGQTLGEDPYPLLNGKGNPITIATSLELNIDEATMNKGSNMQLEATLLPADAGYKELTWSSSDIEVATVSDSGVITAVGVGETEIQVTCGLLTASCLITVIDEAGVESLFIDSEDGVTVYSISGVLIQKASTLEEYQLLPSGLYIINGKKIFKK